MSSSNTQRQTYSNSIIGKIRNISTTIVNYVKSKRVPNRLKPPPIPKKDDAKETSQEEEKYDPYDPIHFEFT